MSLNPEYFGDEKSNLLKSFDAFPKTRPTYTTRTTRGGLLTLLVLFLSLTLLGYELLLFTTPLSTHHFTVESAVAHTLQINLDITVAMPCAALHINVQDAAMERILAGDLLTKEDTAFSDTSAHRLVEMPGRDPAVYEVLQKARGSIWGKSKMKPGARGGAGSCRVYGSMLVNRVRGDIHITAAGHDYYESAAHDHGKFNFSHVINELSFGEYYPRLMNPLDGVVETTEKQFWQFQYYLNIVPTVYKSSPSAEGLLTNQYAVTAQGREVRHTQVPGVFFKYDIEPLSVVVTEERPGIVGFVVRCVNIVGGVMVSGNWVYQVGEVLAEYMARGGRRMEGLLKV